jgi:hypothetical protein
VGRGGGHSVRLSEPAERVVQIALSIQPFSWLLGAAPTLVAAGAPFLNRIIVGIPRTPYVDVDLGNRHLFAKLVRQFLERGADHLARAAPFRPEVDDYRAGRLDHVRLEAAVGDLLRRHREISFVSVGM